MNLSVMNANCQKQRQKAFGKSHSVFKDSSYCYLLLLTSTTMGKRTIFVQKLNFVILGHFRPL